MPPATLGPYKSSGHHYLRAFTTMFKKHIYLILLVLLVCDLVLFSIPLIKSSLNGIKVVEFQQAVTQTSSTNSTGTSATTPAVSQTTATTTTSMVPTTTQGVITTTNGHLNPSESFMHSIHSVPSVFFL